MPIDDERRILTADPPLTRTREDPRRVRTFLGDALPPGRFAGLYHAHARAAQQFGDLGGIQLDGELPAAVVALTPPRMRNDAPGDLDLDLDLDLVAR